MRSRMSLVPLVLPRALRLRRGIQGGEVLQQEALGGIIEEAGIVPGNGVRPILRKLLRPFSVCLKVLFSFDVPIIHHDDVLIKYFL
jgi:hypothetical protein